MREIIPAPISTKQQLRHKYGAHFFVPGLTKSVNREMKDARFSHALGDRPRKIGMIPAEELFTKNKTYDTSRDHRSD